MKYALSLIGVALLGLTLHAENTASPAAAKPAKDTKTYLEELQLKLDHTARRVNQPTASGSSVVGLRGSKQEAKTLYWKSKETDVPVTPEEVKAFRSAVDLARTGQTTQALAALKSFDETYPKSGLKADVLETQRILSTH